MSGLFRSIFNFVRRHRLKPADYSLLHTDPGLHPLHSQHNQEDPVPESNQAGRQGRYYNLKRISMRETREAYPVEEGVEGGFVPESSALQLGTQRVLDVDHLPAPSSKPGEGREEREQEAVRDTDTRLGSVLRRNVKARPSIPVWPAAGDSVRVHTQSEGTPPAGPPPRPPKSPQRMLHGLQGRTMSVPGSSSTPGLLKPPTRRLKKRRVSRMPEVIEDRSLRPRLSQLDLTLMPFDEEREAGGIFTNGVDIESFPRVGGGWDLESPYAHARPIGDLDATDPFTPFTANAETPQTNLFDTPLSLASTLTDYECHSPAAREIATHDDKHSGEKGLQEVNSSELPEGSASVPRETIRQDTQSSLEESVVVPVTRVQLEVDSPQVRLLEGIVNSPRVRHSMTLVEEPIESRNDQIGSHNEAPGVPLLRANGGDGHLGLGIFSLDEVGWNPGTHFEPLLPSMRANYPSIPSITSSQSIPSLPSTSSIASIPSIASSPSIDATTPSLGQLLSLSDDSSSDEGYSLRNPGSWEVASERNSIPFPRLPDVEVPDKPGWILYYADGCYAPIPSSIPLHKRQVWAAGKIQIFQAAFPILQGEPTIGDWDTLLEAFDADPYNWLVNPPVMAFRRVSELELDLKQEYEGTPINWVIAILYEIHSWIRGDTETAQEMCSSLEVAFNRVGWDKGVPPRFIQYLSYVGLAVHVSPLGLEILEIDPRDPRGIRGTGS